MYPIPVAIILIAALSFFAYSMSKRYKLLTLGKASDNLKNIPARIKALLDFGFAQHRLIAKDFVPGLFHAFIFWGFCIVALQTLYSFAVGFSANFHFPFVSESLWNGYRFVKDCIEACVVSGALYFLYRRLISKPARITLSGEGTLILGFILTLMITDFINDGIHFIHHGFPGLLAGPVSSLFGQALLNLSPSSLATLGAVSYFLHIGVVLLFLNFLPYGKHFHVITSLPNVFLRNLKPYGALNPINLEDESVTAYGVSKLNEFTWKDILDVYSCTECGRCTSQCPAWNTGKTLNPKQINIDLKHYMYENINGLTGSAEAREKALIPLVPEVIKPDVLWSCTTCRACEEACPVLIGFVDRIVGMRRDLVLMRGEFPEEAQATLRNIETNGNPWGIGFDERASWAKGLNVPLLSEKNEVEVLYWVGCAGAYDDHNKKVSVALVKILQEAKVDFAILGPEETCTGDSARRIGNEYLFQTLAKQNIETLNKYKFKVVLAQCPHCFNTLKNEYPQFGGNYQVMHHSDYIAQLIKEGRLKPVKELKQKLTYHDSCYLGRYNNIYDAPRKILESIPGVEYKDAELSKETGRCCGAGGGRMWMEEHTGTRVNHKRLEDLQTVRPETIASACPFCKVMITDASKDKQVDVQVRDIAEIFAESLQ
ncbi:MAG: (Fe-S)-binding protein [Deltaproteobacteria bacterium]|nr:(Fe-S)-binding protein [Deltaproteobacteria bacterium]